MVARQKRLHIGMVEKLAHEFLQDLAVLQPVTVLRERRRIPDRIIGGEPDEPTKQEIVIQLFHELALRAQAIEYLDQQGAQQLFRWNRRAPFARIKLPQAAAQIS